MSEEDEKTEVDPGFHDRIDEKSELFELYDGRYIVSGTIHVAEGQNLTITGTLAFTENAKLVIERGGNVLLDGATLTSYCTKSWQGIEVWGDPTQPAEYPHQGKLAIKNNTVIENSVNGIRNVKVVNDPAEAGLIDLHFAGGIIQAVSSTFKNNKTSINLYKYPATGYAHKSANFFNNCDFELDEGYFIDEEPNYMVRMNEIDKVDFVYCRFTSEHGNIEYGKGIFSYASQFKVTGVEDENNWLMSEFNKLFYGMYVLGNGTPLAPVIEHSKFTEVYRGIYAGGLDNIKIVYDTFDIKSDNLEESLYYGLYLDRTTGFTVEENSFGSDYISGNVTSPNKSFGVVVNDAGPLPNRIYRNAFNNIFKGITAMGENKGKFNNTGLVLKCNTFDVTAFDLVVIDQPVTKLSGIAESQGAPSSEAEDMAGNLFDHSAEPNGDFTDILDQANGITYYYPENFVLGYDNVEPLYYTPNVDPIPKIITPFDWTYNSGCPESEEASGGSSEETLRVGIENSTLTIDSTENLLALLIDGGNTSLTQLEVQTSLPPETMQVYSDLMNKSPYLSDTVVSTAIEKEDVLPGAMIRDIMVANPNTAKSETLMSKLDDRWNPLPDYMKAQILAGRSIVSVREETEARLAALKLKKAGYFYSLVRHYLVDTLNPQVSTDSLKALLQQDQSIRSKYLYASLMGKQAAWGQGLNILNNIPAQFDLSLAEEDEHTAFTSFYNALANLHQQQKTIYNADSSFVAGMFAIETSQSGMPSVYARNTLIAMGQTSYTETILIPDLMKSTLAQDEFDALINKVNKVPGQLTIKPNPAKDFIIVAYEIEGVKGAILQINDITGNLKHQFETNSPKDEVVVKTQDWENGVYVATLRVNSKIVESVKFTVKN